MNFKVASAVPGLVEFSVFETCSTLASMRSWTNRKIRARCRAIISSVVSELTDYSRSQADTYAKAVVDLPNIHSESRFRFTGRSNGLDSWVLSEVTSLLFVYVCDTDVTSGFAGESTSKLDLLDRKSGFGFVQ